MQGSLIGLTIGDTKSLDYSSCMNEGIDKGY